MTTHNNSQIIDFPSLVGLGNHKVACSPNTKPRRVVLTRKQFEDYIGEHVDITSKKGKTINQQTKTANLMEYILNDVCKRSNGGLVAVGINQLELRKQSLPDGSTINQNTLSKVLKNLQHHRLLVKVCDSTRFKNSTMFVLGELPMELLESITLKKKGHNRCNTKTRVMFTDRGYDVEKTKICPCCSESKFITKFSIEDERNLLLPVCKECVFEAKELKRRGFKGKLNGWDSAWKAFYVEKEKGLDLSTKEKEVESTDKRRLDREVDILLTQINL